MTNISYIMATSKANLFKKQDSIADMVANANTTAYKAEKDVFGELLVNTDRNERLSFSEISVVQRDNSQGALQSTGRALDAAIVGKGYFMVETPLGTRYTRAGNFRINVDGALVTQEGYPLIGPGGGQVEFSETDTNIEIKKDGLVTANGEERGQIGVFMFENEQLLEKSGQGLYRSNFEDPQPAEEYEVAQAMLENSNVNSVTAMTELLDVARSIDSIKQLEKRHHDLQRNMIRTLTKQ